MLTNQTYKNSITDDRSPVRVVVDPKVCRGRPHIRGTGIHIAIILDALFEGLTPEEIIDHYPSLALDDVRATVSYAIQLAEANGGVAVVNAPVQNDLFYLR